MKFTRRKLGRLVLPLLAPSLGAATGQPPARLALVIGNGTYVDNDYLPHALSDSKRVSQKLGAFGFQVDAATDLNGVELSRAVETFGKKLLAHGGNVVAFFFYAGHAAQNAFGVNYLLPVDATAETPDEVQAQGTAVQPLLQAMDDANNEVNIVILDSCRTWFKDDANPEDPKGLHDMGQLARVLIAYATRSDQTADEGIGLTSSPYSNRFIEALNKQSGDAIVEMLDDVGGKVYNDTHFAQAPVYVNGLIGSGRWSFASAALSAVANTPVPVGTSVTSSFLSQLDRGKLLTFFRNQQSWVDALLARRETLQKFQIDTPVRLAYFLGAIGYETGGFQLKEEGFRFSADKLLTRGWAAVKNKEIAQKLATQSAVDVANFVYADRFDNGPIDNGNGWRYRGRGLLFVVGKSNYKLYGDMIGVDLVSAPDLLNDLEIGFAAAAAYWFYAKCNEAADKRNLKESALRFRHAFTNPKAREIWLKQAEVAVAI